MASLGGFLLGVVLTPKSDRENATRNGLVAGLMPSPLLGALVVAGLERDDDDRDGDGDGDDVAGTVRDDDGDAE